MSSILKALKKVEEERNGIRRSDKPAISSEMLLSSSAPTAASIPRMLVIAGLLLACGGGMVYVVVQPQGTLLSNHKSTPPAKLITDLKNPMARPASPEIKTEQLPPVIDVVPALQKPETIRTPPQLRPSPSATPSSRVTAEQSSVRTPIKLSTSPAPRAAASPVSSQSQAGAAAPVTKQIPFLKVDGIAFQEGNSDNMAIVNGVAVVVGGRIEGVTVEEIRKERVRFSFQGESIDVSLGRSNRQPLR